MKKFKTLFFSVFTVMLLAVVAVSGVFAATRLTVNTDGKVTYTSQVLGIKLLATQNYDNGSPSISYLSSFSGFGSGCEHNETSNVCTLVDEYSNSSITVDLTTLSFTNLTDSLEVLLFVKNYGDRQFVPTFTATSDDTKLTVQTDYYLFDINENHIDPIDVTKLDSANAAAFVNSVETEIAGDEYITYTSGTPLNFNQTLAIRFVINIKSGETLSDGNTALNNFSYTLTFSQPS